MPDIQHKRGSRAALDALAASNGLLVGQVYSITDEDGRIAIATAVNAYTAFAKQSEAGASGVPTGGTTGQVLAKASGTDFDTEWVDQSGGGGGGWATLFDGTPSAVAQIVVDITGYSEIAWSCQSTQHDGATSQAFGPKVSVNGGSTYPTLMASPANSIAGNTNFNGGGRLFIATGFCFGIGRIASSSATGTQTPNYYMTPTLYTDGIEFSFTAGASFNATGNLKVLAR